MAISNRYDLGDLLDVVLPINQLSFTRTEDFDQNLLSLRAEKNPAWILRVSNLLRNFFEVTLCRNTQLSAQWRSQEIRINNNDVSNESHIDHWLIRRVGYPSRFARRDDVQDWRDLINYNILVLSHNLF